MDRQGTTVYRHPSGARLKLVPVRSSTTQTEKIMKETRKTSVRTIKTVTTARHAGQKVVCVNTKVITTTSTSSGHVTLRRLTDTTEVEVLGCIHTNRDMGNIFDLGEDDDVEVTSMTVMEVVSCNGKTSINAVNVQQVTTPSSGVSPSTVDDDEVESVVSSISSSSLSSIFSISTSSDDTMSE